MPLPSLLTPKSIDCAKIVASAPAAGRFCFFSRNTCRLRERGCYDGAAQSSWWSLRRLLSSGCATCLPSEPRALPPADGSQSDWLRIPRLQEYESCQHRSVRARRRKLPPLLADHVPAAGKRRLRRRGTVISAATPPSGFSRQRRITCLRLATLTI